MYGMGTKLQFESYLPIYNTGRHQRECSSARLSCVYEDNITGRIYDWSLQRQANIYLLSDMEMLKCRMLEHEATFKEQVHELHRLYRIQKELMNELKNVVQQKLCSSSQVSLFAYDISCKAAEKVCQIPHLSALGRHPAMGNNELKPRLSFSRESGAGDCQKPTKTSVSRGKKGKFLKSKSTGMPRRKFDLRLPAELYVDTEDEAMTDKLNTTSLRVANPSSPMHSEVSDHDVKLALGKSNAYDCISGMSKLGLHSEKLLSQTRLADLNELAKDTSYEEKGLTSDQYNGVNTEEIQRYQLSSNRSFPSRDLLSGIDGHEKVFSYIVNSDKGEESNLGSSPTNALVELVNCSNGCQRGFCDGRFSITTHVAKEKPNKCYALTCQNHIDKRIEENQTRDAETYNHVSKVPVLNNSVLTASQMPHQSQSVSCSDNSSILAQSDSSCRKPNGAKYIPISFQALTSFNKYAISNGRKVDTAVESPCNPIVNVQCVEDFSTGLRAKSKSSSCKTSLNRDYRHDTCPKRTCIPLIFSEKQSQASCFGNLTLRNYKVAAYKKCFKDLPLADLIKQPLEPYWLKTKLAQRDSLDMNESVLQLMSLNSVPSAVSSTANKQQDEEIGPCTLRPFVDPSSSLHVIERNEASCCSKSKRFLEVSVSGSTQSSAERDLSSAGSINHFDVNLSATCMDALNSAVTIPKCLVSSLQSTAPIVDMEEKLHAKTKKEFAVDEPSKELNPVNATSSEKDDEQQIDSSHEAFMREAAENLVAMSVLIDNHHCHDNCFPSVLALPDTLYWFADIVSIAELSAGARENSLVEDDDTSLDTFEYMTLNLKEIKEDEFICKPLENQDFFEDLVTSLLLTRTRKGQPSKRRAKRDFQMALLSSFASLSRLEVSEDLQAFGGSLRASTKSCEAGSLRSATSKKRQGLKAIGKWRRRSSAMKIYEAHIVS